MIFISKIVVITLSLYFFLMTNFENLNDRSYFILYKLYLFLFIFCLQLVLNLLGGIICNDVNLDDCLQQSIRDALIAVIAFDVYNDLIYNGFYVNYSDHNKILILTILIICFLTSIKLFELLLTIN